MPLSRSPRNPIIYRSLLKAGGMTEMSNERRPKQRFAPECMKTSTGLANTVDSGSSLRRLSMLALEAFPILGSDGLGKSPDSNLLGISNDKLASFLAVGDVSEDVSIFPVYVFVIGFPLIGSSASKNSSDSSESSLVSS